MTDDRITGSFEQALPPTGPGGLPSLPRLLVPAATLYEAARNRAIHDCQMDRLFNPDFYATQSDE